MSAHLVRTLAQAEARMRLRRPASLVTLLAVVALSWLMIGDPAAGETLIASGGARVRYTSSALALGSAAMASLLLGLAGFYLLRGRMADDLRSGAAGVIAASPAGNAAFVLGRWLGGVLYLLALAGAYLLTVLVCHALRGEGPIEPLVYLQTYVLVLAPMLLFAASCATLCDSWAPLMGKAGDLLYFAFWVAQLGMLSSVTASAAPTAIPVDFTGISAVTAALAPYVDADNMMLGMADFDRALAPFMLPSWLWTGELKALRGLAAALALLPLLPAMRRFHRFSPDRIGAGRAQAGPGRARRSPLALLDGWLHPLAQRLATPLFALAARLPGIAGQALADATLALAAAPSSLAVLAPAQVLALALDVRLLAPLVLACVAAWGVLISDVSTRDADAGCASLGAAVPGGEVRRYWRQLAASFLLGLMFSGVAMLRMAAAAPSSAAALLAGLFALAACASLLGRTSGSARAFLALFAFGLYVSVNTGKVALADVIGFHGVATAGSALAWAGMGVAAAWAGHAWLTHQKP